MFPDPLSTDRLRLVRVARDRVDPVAFYRSFWGDPATTGGFEYVPQTPHEHPGETAEWVREAERRWADGERAEYAVRVDGDGIDGDGGTGGTADPTGPVGMAMLAPDFERRTAIVGVLLHRRVWGRGYAGEVLDALAGIAFDRLDLDRVVVEHQPGNERSRRAIEKYVDSRGGRREGRLRNRVPMDGWIDDAIRYEIPRADLEEG